MSQPSNIPHTPVLLQETLAHLCPEEGKTFLDATLGAGGHSLALLERGAKVIAIDQDPQILAIATQRLAPFNKIGKKFTTLQGNFRHFPELLSHANIHTPLDGILFDIGVSSLQLDQPERGFSFQYDAPLDMRMSPETHTTAQDLVNTASQEELEDILRNYGEEPFARRIAKAIVHHRNHSPNSPIQTTFQLNEIIFSAYPKQHNKKRQRKHHPATQTFQALRIAVNDELNALREALAHTPQHLAPNGTLAIITFHSLEDRIAKQFLKKTTAPFCDKPEWTAPKPNPDYHFTQSTRKRIKPTEQETQSNPRARSAGLRIAQKI